MTTRTLWFIVPAHGRLDVAAVCLRQLRRTCDVLTEHGTLSSAVVIADDENLELAQANGFATIERDNAQLGRKINDGYELAGREGINYMVPCGNDDWVDPAWIMLPQVGQTIITHLSTVVNETGTRMSLLNIPYGDGVRVYHRSTLAKVGFRPAEEDRKRAIDASTHNGVKDSTELVWRDTDPLAIVDFKTRENLNSYEGCMRHYGRLQEVTDVWERLAAIYPDDSIREMRALYEREAVAR